MEPTGCSETSANYHQHMLYNNPKQQRLEGLSKEVNQSKSKIHAVTPKRFLRTGGKKRKVSFKGIIQCTIKRYNWQKEL
jgi:hypothetical protein